MKSAYGVRNIAQNGKLNGTLLSS